MMSKIGKKPVELPQGIAVELKGGKASVSGPEGKVELLVPNEVEIKIEGDKLEVFPKEKNKKALAIHGTVRAIMANAVLGVSRGWRKQLELVGVGFRAEVNGQILTLTVGFSHPVRIDAPEGISFRVEKSVITVEGVDKELVGQIAAKIRAVRPPEPYKGKGIKYLDEVVRRKTGKAAKTVGAGPV